MRFWSIFPALITNIYIIENVYLNWNVIIRNVQQGWMEFGMQRWPETVRVVWQIWCQGVTGPGIHHSHVSRVTHCHHVTGSQVMSNETGIVSTAANRNALWCSPSNDKSGLWALMTNDDWHRVELPCCVRWGECNVWALPKLTLW